MPKYVQPEVERLRDGPSSGAFADLVVVPEDGAEDAVRERVESLGIEVTREVEFGMLAVRVEETDIEDLCEVEDLRSVTFDEELEVLGSGNRQRR